VRPREREKERERDIQTERDRDRQTDSESLLGMILHNVGSRVVRQRKGGGRGEREMFRSLPPGGSENERAYERGEWWVDEGGGGGGEEQESRSRSRSRF
jgi:hypothetical protein